MERITATDIDVILATDLRRYARDTRALRALLTDVAHSLRAASSDVERLHKDVDRMRSLRRSSTSPLAAAVDAVSELSTQQRQEVFTMLANTVMQQLNEQLRHVRARQIAVVSAARAAADKISDHDPELADDIRQLAQAGHVHSSQLEVDFEPFTVTTFDSLFAIDSSEQTHDADNGQEPAGHTRQVAPTEEPRKKTTQLEETQLEETQLEETSAAASPVTYANVDNQPIQHIKPEQWDELFADSTDTPQQPGHDSETSQDT